MKASRTILVTGATRGLGRAIVDRFIEAGHTVIGCGRSAAAISELSKRYGAPHAFQTVDVSDDRAVAAWAKSVLAFHGPPDLVLNNAAVINENAPLWKIGVEEFGKVIDVNIKGVANVIRHFAPAMIERKRGVIVNFSSGWGRSTAPDVAPYCATKWAIEGLTQAFSQELPAGMAAVALNPGIIDTQMLRSCFGGSASQFPDAEKWSRVAASYVLGLCTESNGQALSVPI